MHSSVLAATRPAEPLPVAPPHVAIVEDDVEIGIMVARVMGDHGFRVSRVRDGRGLDRTMAQGKVDVVLLDLMLPGGEDGLSICGRLRAASAVPILLVTARASEADRIVGLELGADDYVVKPFSPRELVARVRAVLRRGALAAGAPAGEDGVFVFEGWRLDQGRHSLHGPDGARVALTTGEFSMLAAFCRHPRKVLSRDQLLSLLHGRGSDPFDRSIDIQVSRLRRKIEPNPKDPSLIKTIRQGGYLFTPEVRPGGPA